MVMLLIQSKFLPLKMSARIKQNLITLFLLFFSIFNINHCYAVAVGEPYGGGTVFCVSKTTDITQCAPEGSGDSGLIMANKDQANIDSPNHGVTWSSAYSEIPNAQSEDDGTANTAAIIAAFHHDNPSNNAAWLCHNYRDQKEKNADWYLPSKNELNKMYVYAKANNLIGKGCSGSKPGGVQCLVGGDDEKYKIYWSSSEYSGSYNDAWFLCFSSGDQYFYSKINFYLGVRAVRAFSRVDTPHC